MSKSEILYVKGMNMSETEEDEDLQQDIWDDKKLNDAYDRALRIANVEVAKRVAMSTNTHGNKDDQSKSKKGKPTKKKHDWKVGSPCRAVYEGDGLEYEAFILRIINDKECVVRFLGYDNSEIVRINTLKPSQGNDARTEQIEQALQENADAGFRSQTPNSEVMDFKDEGVSSPGIIKEQPTRKQKSLKKKTRAKGNNSFEIPDMPFSMPNASLMKTFGSMEMPFPPPPPLNFSNAKTDSEEQAISSMLLSWYMSGYYTGLYQGMQRAKKNGRNE